MVVLVRGLGLGGDAGCTIRVVGLLCSTITSLEYSILLMR